MVWQAGQSLYGNRYTIQKAIGKGGFGITYLAEDGKGRAWVIKTLKDEVMTQEEYAEYRDKYLRDFKDEALRLAICRHAHIVQIENFYSSRVALYCYGVRPRNGFVAAPKKAGSFGRGGGGALYPADWGGSDGNS